MNWENDEQLFDLLRQHLYTPVVGDTLDRLGRLHQFLPQPIKPLRENMKLAGRAMPVLCAAVTGLQAVPFGKLTAALDDLQPGEIYLATGALDCASWGEIMTATAKTRRAAGAVIDGFHRDTPQVLAQDWPVFSRGSYAQDAAMRSSVVDFRCTVEAGGVRISPGDLVFGDIDGVLIIPRELEREAIALALEKVQGERTARRDIEAGASSTSVFAKYGIL
jgi:regulator of RNase E activity RraA